MLEPQQTKTILFLLHDHDPVLLQVIKSKFKKEAGWESILSFSYDEAIKLFQLHNPDAVLTELTSFNPDGSGKNGLDLIEAIRKMEKPYKDTPVVVYSELDSADDKAKALEMGANFYFCKNEVTIQQVIAMLKGILVDL